MVVKAKKSSVSQALFWKNEWEGGDFFWRQIFFKQNLVWRKYGLDSLNKIFEAGWKNECAGAWETEDQFLFA